MRGVLRCLHWGHRLLRLSAGALWCVALLHSPAWAHKGSDAYLDVQEAALGELHLSLAVAVKDLDLVLPLDTNADGQVTWGEAQAATPAVLQWLGTVVQLDSADALSTAPAHDCHLAWAADGFERRSDGSYLRAVARTQCDPAQPLRLHYAVLREQDATHRLLITGQMVGQSGRQALLSTTSPQSTEPVLLRTGNSTLVHTTSANTAPVAHVGSGRLATLMDYLGLGMHHLLEGYDHLAFLLALVLPLRLPLWAQLRRRYGLARGMGIASALPTAQPVVWWDLLRTITAFTVGHSITLLLATMGWTQASPLWVEPLIAASIAVTACLNLRPVAWLRTDVLALGFGMVHGYGFAGLLQEAAAPSGLLPWALAGFNVGVELGQLLAVSGWVLLSQLVVGKDWYARMVVRGGSVALIALASWWFWQRV
jgi:HupE / UreJ protein